MKKPKIFIAGHNGMIGSAILKHFKKKKIIKYMLRIEILDLTKQETVFKYLNKIKPDSVIIAAAKVGGIVANNTYRASFLYDNLSIQTNVIHGSYISGVKNLIFLGSSCIYPKTPNNQLKKNTFFLIIWKKLMNLMRLQKLLD